MANSEKTVFITGGNGFVASQIISDLIEVSDDAGAIDSDSGRALPTVPGDVARLSSKDERQIRCQSQRDT